jgi:hypothetical protein
MITFRSSGSRASARFLFLVPFWSLIGDRKRILESQGDDLVGEFDPVWDGRLLG